MSHELAKEHAQAEFLKYDEHRRAMEARQSSSDFDRLVDESEQVQARLPPPKPNKPRRQRKPKEPENG